MLSVLTIKQIKKKPKNMGKLLEMTDMFITLIVVMVTLMYAYVQTQSNCMH